MGNYFRYWPGFRVGKVSAAGTINVIKLKYRRRNLIPNPEVFYFLIRPLASGSVFDIKFLK